MSAAFLPSTWPAWAVMWTLAGCAGGYVVRSIVAFTLVYAMGALHR